MKTQKYDEHRTYLGQILDAMKKTEADLSARLDELRDQKKMLEDAVQALNVFEHVTASKED